MLYWNKLSGYQQRVQRNRKQNCSTCKSAKTDKIKVAILSLVLRKDKLNVKAKEVNTFLNENCEANNFELIFHFNITPRQCKRSKMPMQEV